MKSVPSRRYTDEFKREAVRLVLVDGIAAMEVSRRLDVPNQTIANWLRLAREPGQAQAVSPVTVSELQAELARVRAENSQLKMDKEILKKAAAYFAKEQS